ncbi:sulfatase-like hydrolase/transferase [Weissella paramesenteroides]|uniref:sulfatase-like hydrolase/transferase n=1 Tax=Weissella paramesenteroides TaxID=1249 RepID=UPI00388EEAB1
MKKILIKKFVGPSFNSWMRLLSIGIIASVLTTAFLQFTIHFQVWGRWDAQSTDIHVALHYVFQFFTRPQVLYSVLACLLLFIFIVVLVNRLFIGIAVYSVLAIIAIVAEYMKMNTRNEPIIFSDISELTAVNGLTKMINKNLLIISVVAIVILLICATILEIYLHRKKSSIFSETVQNMMFKQSGSRLLVLLTSLGLLVAPFIASADQNRAMLNHFGYNRQNNIMVDDSMVNGPIMTFVSNISSVIMREPDGYSAKEMLRIQKKYTNYADVLNKTRQDNLKGQTVISILSESLTDPNEVPNLEYKGKNVYKNISQIKKKAVLSGKMLSSGYGGGTANIEYMTLAGFPLATFAPEMTVPYTQLVPYAHKVPILPNLFDQREVLHPFAGMFYNRRDAYKDMGIQKFYTTDGLKYKYPKKFSGKLSSETDYIADKNAYKFLMKRVDTTENKKSQFLQLITMQNHMPYKADEYPNSKYEVLEPAVSSATKKQVETYITGVHETDVATKKLIDSIEDLKRPITLIFYGDHWPVAFTFVNQEAQMKKSHETDYFIYQNKAAREKNRESTLQLTKRPYASPSDFPTLALKATNSKVTPFFALQEKVVDELPTFANYARNTFVDSHGKELKTKNLTSSQKKTLHELKLVQYDLSAGKHYLSNEFTDKK